MQTRNAWRLEEKQSSRDQFEEDFGDEILSALDKEIKADYQRMYRAKKKLLAQKSSHLYLGYLFRLY